MSEDIIDSPIKRDENGFDPSIWIKRDDPNQWLERDENGMVEGRDFVRGIDPTTRRLDMIDAELMVMRATLYNICDLTEAAFRHLPEAWPAPKLLRIIKDGILAIEKEVKNING